MIIGWRISCFRKWKIWGMMENRLIMNGIPDGSYSEWISSGRTSVTHKNFGSYKTDLYDARFYWDYDLNLLKEDSITVFL